MVVGAFGVGLIWTHRESGCLPDGICLFLRLGERRKRPLVSPGVVITAAQAFHQNPQACSMRQSIAVG